MNQTYLMRYTSYQLHTIVRQYSSGLQLQHRFCARPAFSDEAIAPSVLAHVRTHVKSYCDPVLLSINHQINYAFIPVLNQFFLVGPFRFHDFVSLKHQIVIENLDADFPETVAVLDFQKTISLILLIYNLYQTESYEEQELILSNCVQSDTESELFKQHSSQVFYNLEYGKIHNPYDQEVREFTSIENGDIEQLKRSLEEDYLGEIGTLAKNPLRQAKNRAIVVITLASRSALRAGVIPEVAYSLSDSYIQQVEECNDVPTLFHLFHSAEFQYAQLVKELKEQKTDKTSIPANSHVSKCKDYIYAHLHDKISVKDIASELHVNVNYLSTLFRKVEHMSLTDYIRKQKINLAKNLLIYSHYSYIEIAVYLGFSSQSHLGKAFKQTTGYTPRRYREMFGMKEFLN
ncbi:MAG: AraC family transcriptional regulator [Hespellia sp.]|nr:AraC family transcriptional regulator [Hespellia sp.]